VNTDVPRGRWEIFVETFFRQDLIDEYSGAILKGMVVTIEIAILVVLCGLALGLVLAMIRAYRVRAINVVITVFVDVLRALPPLALILLVYFGLPLVGLNFSSFVVLWLVLTLVLAAFAEEIFWAGILSVHKGQWEAARSTGLGFSKTLTLRNHFPMRDLVATAVPYFHELSPPLARSLDFGKAMRLDDIPCQDRSCRPIVVPFLQYS